MRTGSLFFMRVRKRLCVSVFWDKPSISFLVNIGCFPIPLGNYWIFKWRNEYTFPWFAD